MNNGLAVPTPPLPAEWGCPDPGHPDYEWFLRRLSPQTLRSYTTALTLGNSVGNGLPRTYVRCTKPQHPALESSRQLVRTWEGWDWIDTPARHTCMITNPDLVTDLLIRLAE